MSQDSVSLCLINGNPDLYGLGIRLGIYSQIIATLLVHNFLPNEVSGAWDTNGIFLLAVFAAVANATVTLTIQYVEAFLMLQLIFAFLLAVVSTNSRLKWAIRGALGIMEEKDFQFLEKHLSASKIGESWRAYLALAIACYNVWFWFSFDAPSSCRAYIFLFTKLSPESVGQQVFRVFAVLYLFYKGFPFAFSCVARLVALPSTFKYLLDEGREVRDDYRAGGSSEIKSIFTPFLDFYYRQGKKAADRDVKFIERLRRHQSVGTSFPDS